MFEPGGLQEFACLNTDCATINGVGWAWRFCAAEDESCAGHVQKGLEVN